MTAALRRGVGAFWRRAYEENVTGMAAMVAYNLMLSVFPFALLLLFITGQLLQSSDVQTTILRDLQELFPSTEQDTLRSTLDDLRARSTEIGIVAIVAGLWIGASFWGAMDTAFCRIYHVECRGWWAQKRFSLIMLAVVALFLAASVAVPAAESFVLAGTDNLPLGLDDIDWLGNLVVIAGGLLISFLVLCVIYWAVPKGHLPWRAVWPGALFMSLAAGIANFVFPLYLVNLSTIGQFGRIVSFVLIALLWFYALALGLLAGGVINALRFELHDTGTVRGMTAEFQSLRERDDPREEPERERMGA
ncbi:MAG: YihY/virulence factor BrkB family protein [Solirubrobacterales bacterium]|nr:YihY/virulence factor BrkB family protein [Solirubrobacterales bacterium]MCB8969403.1 YihY/virulence factor BrkB family protein [Thermoleophilales bacterium]MCO5327339.1 YihY/virulence factor BrkB family protein [Solirubrobacterales bacterium]